VGGATAQPGSGSIDSKRAEAQRVIAQIDAMDTQLEARVQAYDDATYKLGKIQEQLKTTTRELGYARTSLQHAQVTLQQRAVALYTQGQDDSTVSVLLGATSLDDLMNRLDTAKRVSRQDADVVQSVTHFRDTVKHQQVFLAQKRVEQQRTVAKRAAEKGTVERQIAARQAYLTHVKGEIAQLIAQQRAAQLAAAQRRAAQARAALAAATANPATAVSTDGANVTGTVVDSGPTGGPPPSGHGNEIASLALAEQGKPYLWAAAGPDNFDCSGLVVYVFAKLGIAVPHSSYAQAGMGAPVDRADLQPGDLVFFDGNGHVGIYVGGGNFVHAPHTGTVVQVSSLDGHGSYDGARRL
jgi:cell wall-associated NlpC family hydrolase